MNDFRTALLWHMEKHHTTIAELARGAQVSADLIKKIRTRDKASTKAEPAERIAAFYGKAVAEFIRCEDLPDSENTLNALIDLLTGPEREMLVAQMRGILASRAKR